MRTIKAIPLPESEWHTCPSCGGTGSYFSEGDLHRSPGTIPCQRSGCRGGVIKVRYEYDDGEKVR